MRNENLGIWKEGKLVDCKIESLKDRKFENLAKWELRNWGWKGWEVVNLSKWGFEKCKKRGWVFGNMIKQAFEILKN